MSRPRLERVAGTRMHRIADPADHCPLLDQLTTRPDATIARGRVLKHDGTTTVVVVGNDQRWVVKRYNTKNRWHAVRRLLRVSRAVNCWRAAGQLAAAGIDTARPVAVLEERWLGCLRGRSYFIAELVPGETLASRLARTGDPGLVESVAQIVRRLREHAIVHGDLKATNFIVSGVHIHLVDLDATRRTSGRDLDYGLKKDHERFLRNWRDRRDLLQVFAERLAAL